MVASGEKNYRQEGKGREPQTICYKLFLLDESCACSTLVTYKWTLGCTKTKLFINTSGLGAPRAHWGCRRAPQYFCPRGSPPRPHSSVPLYWGTPALWRLLTLPPVHLRAITRCYFAPTCFGLSALCPLAGSALLPDVLTHSPFGHPPTPESPPKQGPPSHPG